MCFSFKKIINKEKGFTLVELMVSVGIFVFMTALLLSKYGSFNQGILLTNLAYDVALTIRTAQSYGLNVKSRSRTLDQFEGAFGVYFDTNNSGTPAPNTQIILFADVNGNNKYDSGEQVLKYLIKKGVVVSELYYNSNISINTINIIFKRPDPKALIFKNTDTNINDVIDVVTISLKTPDNSIRKIYVRSTGQVGVVN
jgi:prepilin-type N-terminal cleavage/methylation domain-containing protein